MQLLKLASAVMVVPRAEMGSCWCGWCRWRNGSCTTMCCWTGAH